MTYLIGAILLVLLIALVLVFKPPKQKPYEDVAQQEPPADEMKPEEDQLDLEVGQGKSEKEAVDDDMVLTLDESEDTEQAAKGDHEEIEELDLDLLEEEETATTSDDSSAATEEKGRDEFDEDIPFIDDEAGGVERKEEVAPALADVPDDYALVDDDEPPEELAERLEYFLGTDDEDETEAAVDEPAAEGDDTVDVDAEEEVSGESAETEEAEEKIEAEADSGEAQYTSWLKEQIDRLRNEMNEAIDKRQTTKMASLAVALENAFVNQDDIAQSYQAYQQRMKGFMDVLSELREELPGFQFETVESSVQKREYDVVGNLVKEAADQLDNSPQLASDVLYHWGRMEEERGDLDSALELYSKACDKDNENINSLLAAGRLARIAGDNEKAMSLLEKRVAAGQESGEEGVDLARAEHELVKALTMEDKDKERVEELLNHALETMEKQLGTAHPDLGPVLHDMAVLYDSGGRYEQAEPLYKRAIEVVEQGLGSESPRLGTTLNRLAGLYEEIEQEEQSEPMYTRALAIRKRVLGENHPDVGAIMGHLANFLRRKGKLEQAEPMYRKSLEISEAALGKDHPNLAMVFNDMAELYSEMGNQEQAEYFQERAFAAFGMPGLGDGFVEMEKDTAHDDDDDANQKIAGS